MKLWRRLQIYSRENVFFYILDLPLTGSADKLSENREVLVSDV